MKYLKFKATILLLIIGFFAIPSAFASSDCDLTDVIGLDAAAMATLRVACEQALLDAAKAPAASLASVAEGFTDPNKLSAYGIVAQEWAKALGIAATELGIAVDTFLDTDAGKLTAAIIIWQVMGETLVGFAIGIPLLIVVIWLGIRTARRAKIRSITMSETQKNWRGKPIVSEIVYWDEDQTVMYWLAYVVTIILSIMVISLVIFP